ncbi:MAG TPA: adenylate/guanylate cyclase domain-containing protein, partial [Acidimicrobiales bacterium]|nr:adenylate/guanylate cyclase domain-containing protein [Acidimicrobiales bacterium]
MREASLGHRIEAGGPSAAPLQVAPAGAAAAAKGVAPLSAYVPRIALQWMADSPDERHRAIEGSLAFVDVSGFTALTERLAARGRAGAEEINDIIGSTFTELARLAAHDGADLLKWGGDAALLLFEGPSSAERAARSAWRMVEAMARAGRLRTSAGRVALRVSVGVHSGRLELFLLGELHRELIVAGPGATSTAKMEATAAAGEVVVSLSTAALLAAAGEEAVLGERKGDGIVLRDEPRPRGDWGSPVLRRADGDEAAALLMPERARRHLLAGGEQAEHRPVAVGFVQVSGLDAVVEE